MASTKLTLFPIQEIQPYLLCLGGDICAVLPAKKISHVKGLCEDLKRCFTMRTERFYHLTA